MSIFLSQEINPDCRVALWRIEESEIELREKVFLSSEEQEELQQISHPDKRREFLGARAALQSIIQGWQQSYRGLEKDSCAKPFLKELDFSISISHTQDFGAAIVHKVKEVGIDMEPKRQKLFRIAHKFLSEEEAQFTGDDLAKITLIWAAKEAVYKLYGKKKLVFREQIQVKDFLPSDQGQFPVNLGLDNNQLKHYLVNYIEVSPYFLTFTF